MIRYVLMAVAVLMLAHTGADAQPRRQMMGQRQAFERVESFKKVRMMETLKLDEDQSVKLIARYNSHREKMQDLDQEANVLFDKLESLIQSNASESDYNQAFAAVRDYERRRSEERQKYYNDLKEVLSPKQLAEYMVFERNFARDLREAVREVKMERLKKR